MRIVAEYPFNDGKAVIEAKYPQLLEEVRESIATVDASLHKTKESKEKTMVGRMFYSPSSINGAFKQEFKRRGWKPIRVMCAYPTEYYVEGYSPRGSSEGAFREMDFVKSTLGLEIQFGKYAFMVYNVCAKMTIFRNLKHIEAGIEIVPVYSFAEEMSTGVSYFEQFTWDLKERGVSNLDIPVLILGIDT